MTKSLTPSPDLSSEMLKDFMHVKLQLGASVVSLERKKRHFVISKGERGGRGHLIKDTSGFFVRLSGRSIGGHFWPLMES